MTFNAAPASIVDPLRIALRHLVGSACPRRIITSELARARRAGRSRTARRRVVGHWESLHHSTAQQASPQVIHIRAGGAPFWMIVVGCRHDEKPLVGELVV